VFWMAYGSTSGGLVRQLPFLKKCFIDLGVKFLLSIHCRKTGVTAGSLAFNFPPWRSRMFRKAPGSERPVFALNQLPGHSVLLTLVGSPSWVVKRDAAGPRRIRLSTQELPGSARKNPESDRAAVLGYIIVDRTSDRSQVSG